MGRYMGLDAHASSCTVAVVSPRGKRLGSQVVETNARCLIKAVSKSQGLRDALEDDEPLVREHAAWGLER